MALSPNGRKLAFTRQERDMSPPGGSAVVVLDLVTGKEETVFHDPQGGARSPSSWSPDGLALAYFVVVDLPKWTHAIAVAEYRDGHWQHRLVTPPSQSWTACSSYFDFRSPHWDSTGRWLFGLAQYAEDQSPKFYAVRRDGSTSRRVLADSNLEMAFAVPGFGKILVYNKKDSAYYWLDWDSGQRTPLAVPTEFNWDELNYSRFSPDGKYLTFFGDRGVTFLADPDGRSLRNIFAPDKGDKRFSSSYDRFWISPSVAAAIRAGPDPTPTAQPAAVPAQAPGPGWLLTSVLAATGFLLGFALAALISRRRRRA